MSASGFPLVAVDVGNSRIKLGFFVCPSGKSAADGALEAPVPVRTLDMAPDLAELTALLEWLGGAADQFAWWIGSVERSVSTRLVAWLRDQGCQNLVLLSAQDLPLAVGLPRPDMVGIDRLLGAVAANRLRHPESPAIIVDLGTAITVDLVGEDGSFRGGAILPGIGLSARALHAFTDLLPMLEMQALAEPPASLGTNTLEALRAGIYWGAVGGVRQLIALLSAGLPREPQIFLTGGAAPAVAGLIDPHAEYAAHLVLSGIALSAAAAVR